MSGDTLLLNQIVRNPDAIRQVKRESVEFKGLVDSVKANGVLLPIRVRLAPDGSGKYMLIDGDHRYTASEELGLEKIPVVIVSATDEQGYEEQFVANYHKVDTAPAEFGAHLKRILGRNPSLTMGELATKLSVTTQYLQARLRLAELHPDIAKLVDAGTINLSNAVALAALPQDEQLNYLEAAGTQTTAEFRPVVEERLKEIKKAAREGREANPPSTEYQHVSHLRNLKEIEEFVAQPSKVMMIPGVNDVDTAVAAILWCIKSDAGTVAEMKALYDAKQAEKNAKKEATQRERDAKIAADLARRAAEAQAKVASPAASSTVV